MAEKEPLLLDSVLQQIAQEQLKFNHDKAAITAEVAHTTSLLKQWPVKVLTILGGMLAMGTLLAGIATLGLLDSGIVTLMLGVISLILAEIVIRMQEDTPTDALGVAMNISGYVLLGFGLGLGRVTDSASVVALTLGIAALLVLLFSRSTICVFLAVLVLNGSLPSLIFIHKAYNLAHVLVTVLAGLLSYVSLFEAKLLATFRTFIHAFGAVRMGLVFSLLGVLVLTVHQDMLSTRIGYMWVSGVVLIGCLLLLLHRVLRESGLTDKKTLAIFYTCCGVVLLPTVLAPSVPGALLVVLSSFYIGHRTGLWVGLLALAYFLVLFYYDLNITLLAKSGVLAGTGALFLGGLYLLNRYLRSHEA